MGWSFLCGTETHLNFYSCKRKDSSHVHDSNFAFVMCISSSLDDVYALCKEGGWLRTPGRYYHMLEWHEKEGGKPVLYILSTIVLILYLPMVAITKLIVYYCTPKVARYVQL